MRVDGRDCATTARIGAPGWRLTYSAGTGPATVFAKAVDPEHADLVALTSGLYPRTAAVHFRSGRCTWNARSCTRALIDEDAYDFVMVMEDLTARGADPRDATRPLTVDQAASGRARAGADARTGTGAPACSTIRHWGGWNRSSPWDGLENAPLPAALERLGARALPRCSP